MTDTEFTREIRVHASYDHRDDPSGQRGANGAELILILRGPLGAITARIMTGWIYRPIIGRFVPGRPQNRRDKVGVDEGLHDSYPMGVYVGSHSPVPREGCDEDGPCELLGVTSCYCTGSYDLADEILGLLVRGGSDVAFGHMEQMYQSWIVDRPVIEASA